ncbi:hypothetical protein ACU5EH_16280 [Aliivibrio salmonicida]|uniref:hypothetical protein n=1 Tax=Aliivibrio salmonicida TaxID=40269 RepID=UPI00406C1839
MVINPNKDSELNNYASRYLFNKQGWDMQLPLGKSHLDYVIGAIYGAGLRGELLDRNNKRHSLTVFKFIHSDELVL